MSDRMSIAYQNMRLFPESGGVGRPFKKPTEEDIKEILGRIKPVPIEWFTEPLPPSEQPKLSCDMCGKEVDPNEGAHYCWLIPNGNGKWIFEAKEVRVCCKEPFEKGKPGNCILLYDEMAQGLNCTLFDCSLMGLTYKEHLHIRDTYDFNGLQIGHIKEAMEFSQWFRFGGKDWLELTDAEHKKYGPDY